MEPEVKRKPVEEKAGKKRRLRGFDIIKSENKQLKKENNQLKNDILDLKSKITDLEMKYNDFRKSVQLLITDFQSDFQINEQIFKNFKSSIDLELINIFKDLSQYYIIEEKQLDKPWNLTTELVIEATENLSQFTCLFCKNIVDSPVECIECGKIYCLECINKSQSQQKNECPCCRESPFKSRNLNRIVKDVLGKLKFNCPLKCGESFDYSNKEKHISCCNNINTIHKCNLCSSVLPIQENIEDDHKLKCENLITKCPYCKEQIMKFNYKCHIVKCPKSFVHCKECKINISPQFQDNHKNFFCNEIKKILNSVFALINHLQQL